MALSNVCSNVVGMAELPPTARRVDPPIRVWVDLGGLLRPHSHALPGKRRRDGVDTTGEVSGFLGQWISTADGHLLGLTTYDLTTRDGEWGCTVTHYVPSHLLRKRGYVRGTRGEEKKPRRHG